MANKYVQMIAAGAFSLGFSDFRWVLIVSLPVRTSHVYVQDGDQQDSKKTPHLSGASVTRFGNQLVGWISMALPRNLFKQT